MSVRRDPKTDSWFFRTRVTFPDGTRDRIYGTPGIAGLYHDLPNTRRGADAAEQRAIARALTGDSVSPAKEVPTIRGYVDPFLDGYSASHKPSTKLDKRHRLNAYILPAVGDVRLDMLRQEHIDSIVGAQLERKLGRKTVNNILGVLSSLVKYAVENGVIKKPGIRFTIKAQGAEIDAVDPGDVDLLADAAKDPRYRFAILAAADAGLRIGEIRALPRLELNDLAREMTIATSYDRNGKLSETKGWERRVVPMTERLWRAARAVEIAGPLVFARLDGQPIGYDAVRDGIHAIYTRADVEPPQKPWHSLRHTFGTELANRGTPVHVIRALMGHKSIETTLRYMHTDRAAKRAAVETLRGLGSGRAVDDKTIVK